MRIQKERSRKHRFSYTMLLYSLLLLMLLHYLLLLLLLWIALRFLPSDCGCVVESHGLGGLITYIVGVVVLSSHTRATSTRKRTPENFSIAMSPYGRCVNLHPAFRLQFPVFSSSSFRKKFNYSEVKFTLSLENYFEPLSSHTGVPGRAKLIQKCVFALLCISLNVFLQNCEA